MADLKLAKAQKALIVTQIQRYFERELDQDIGEFEAEFLLDFFNEKIGNYYYNEGLRDAQAALSAQMDNLIEAIDVLEKPLLN